MRSSSSAWWLACALAIASLEAQSSHSFLAPLRADADRLIKAATADDFAWRRLAELTDTFGARLSGSPNLARAIQWSVQTMKADGLENVRTEPVMVPRWVRGREEAEIIDPPRHDLAILGLGGTVATPPGGLEAELLVVNSFDDLRSRAAEARGKIVLFDVMYGGYAETVTYRNGGARAAAQHGAVAVLVRSIGPDRAAHRTHRKRELRGRSGGDSGGGDCGRRCQSAGSSRAERPARSPAPGARRTSRGRRGVGQCGWRDRRTREAERDRAARRSPRFVGRGDRRLRRWRGVHHHVGGRTTDGEARDSAAPHVRIVLWTNEENGLRGASAYAERYAASAADHVFALESDLGVFAPAALGFSGSMAARAMIGQIGSCSSRSVFRRLLPAAVELISVPSPRRAGFRRWRISVMPVATS